MVLHLSQNYLMESPPASPPALPGRQPVSERERIASLDILRGVALFGILLINIPFFAMVFAAGENPFVAGELSPLDYAAWRFNYSFVEGRAISTFGILFGAGIILSTQRQDRAGLPVAASFYRRYGILAAIGLLHAYFIWFGDILFSYAVAGAIVFLLRKLPPKILLSLGTATFVFAVAFFSVFHCLQIPELEQHSWPTQEEIAQEIEAVRGPWRAWFIRNAMIAATLQFLALPFGLGAFCMGLMLLGMGLQKSGFFEGSWPLKTYVATCILGLLSGLLLTLSTEQVRQKTHFELSYFSVLLGQLAPTLMAFGYLALVLLLLRNPVAARILTLFSPAGRMALTLYLMQSIICSFVFNGYGLGKFETMGRASLWLFCLVLYLFQLLFAHLWLRRHRFGPLEWAWRRLSYGSLK